MTRLVGMKARLNPGTKIKAKKGYLGYLLGEGCYAVKAVQYLGKGEFRPYYKNGRLNTKCTISTMDYKPVSLDPNREVEETELLIDNDGCVLQFIDGYLYLETCITNTLERHTEIEYRGGGVFYSETGVRV